MKVFGLRTALVALLISVCVSAFAQGGSVKLRLEDAGSGEPVGYAAVSLNIPVVQVNQPADSLSVASANQTEDGQSDSPESASDTLITYKPYKYAMCDAHGAVEFKAVRAGTYMLKVEFVGYETIEKTVDVGTAAVDLGVMKMSEDVEILAAASIMETAYPVIVKKDTIEYSTVSYKTLENDTLEDLLKKLPGVEVEDDGSVTVNGEAVTKITINGKSFFLDDPTMATKNLDAKIIDKIKVVEKKSDQAIFTGIDDGVRETVIDLAIKPGMLESWSGTVSGGGGHDIPPSNGSSVGNGDWRYRGSATLKRFTDLSQLTVLGNGDNINDGTRTSWGAGINGAYNLLDGDMDLAAHYKYSGSHVRTESESEKITYMDDGSDLILDREVSNVRNTQTHDIGVKLEHKFSENTSIKFEPKFKYTETDSHNYANQTTHTDYGTGEDSELTNSGFTDNTSWTRSWSTSGYFLLRQKFGLPGRTLSVGLNYSFSGTNSDGYKQSLTETVPEDADGGENGELDVETLNQRYTTTSSGFSINPYLTYIEPLVNNDLFLQVSLGYALSIATYDRESYDSATNVITTDGDGDRHLVYNSEGEEWNEAYSNSIDRMNNEFHSAASLRYQGENWRIQLGVQFRSLIRDVETDGDSYHLTSPRWYPQGMFSFDFSEHSNMRLTYSAGYSSPTLTQLMPVTNNSNPLNVSFGNPYLDSGFTHNLRGTFSYTNKETFTTVRANWTGSITQDRITTASWYDSAGAQYSMPLNGPSGGNTSLVVTLNTPLSGSNFSIINTTNFRYSNTMVFTGITEGDVGNELTGMYYDSESGVMDYERFNNDFFGSVAAQNFNDYFVDSKTETLSFTERLRFKYICDLVEVYFGGRTIMSKSWRSVSSNNSSANWRNMVDISTNWTFPEGIGLSVDGKYNWYDGYSTRRDDEFVVNAGIWKNLFESKFTVGVRAYDIFNQTQSFNVTDASNYHLESRTNTFGRYVILTLTYRFGENGQR